MVKKAVKKVVRKTVKAAPLKAGKSANVVKKVSYGTGALCKTVKGKVSGLRKRSSDSEPWKKVLAVTETFCEKVSETTADVYGRVTKIVQKSTADMTESFKAGMSSVKAARTEGKAALSPKGTARKVKGTAKGARKPKSRVEKFMKDEAAVAAVEPVVDAPAAVEVAEVAEAQAAAEAVAPADAGLEQEITRITQAVKET